MGTDLQSVPHSGRFTRPSTSSVRKPTRRLSMPNAVATPKGILLAGGSGTRLYPITLAMSKQLLPVYDKPMVYYPLSVLMLAGIRDMLLISTPHDLPRFRTVAGRRRPARASRFSYAVQPKPKGLAQAFIIGREFVGGDAWSLWSWATIFSTARAWPRGCSERRAYARARRSSPIRSRTRAVRRGRVRRTGRAISIEEKPAQPKSQLRGAGAVLLRQPGGGHRRPTEALRPRRTGNHGRQPRVPAAWPVAGGTAGPRVCVAGYGHAGIAAAGRDLRRSHRATPGPENRLPGRNRLPQGLHHTHNWRPWAV